MVAGLFFCKQTDIVCETNFYKESKELILSVFTALNEENFTRRIYVSALADI